MSINAVKQLAAAYNLSITAIAQAERGYRNHSFRLTLADGTYRNLIQYKRDADIIERIRRANAVGEFLATTGLPVRAPADPRILKISGRATVTHAALYNYLPGDTIPWEAYTQKHIKALGATLGIMHAHLTALPQPQLIQAHSATAELTTLTARMQAYFTSAQVIAALSQKLGIQVNQGWLTEQPRLIMYLSQLPNQQPLHLDLVRSNVLFQDATITGIIDFEKTAWGHPTLDVARSLAFLLVDCRYKTPNQIRKYFVYSGYIKRGGGAAPNARLLEALVSWYLFYDFYKFLRHTPYESLPHNQHFVRTCSILVHQRNILLTMSSNNLYTS